MTPPLQPDHSVRVTAEDLAALDDLRRRLSADLSLVAKGSRLFRHPRHAKPRTSRPGSTAP